MRVLVVNERRSEREAIVKALPRAAYAVEAVADEPSALAAMRRESAQIVIVAPHGKGDHELVRKLRSYDASGYAYILALVDGAPLQKDLSDLFGAGVNDFLRRPLCDAELIARIKAPPRRVGRSPSAAKAMALDFSAPVDVTGLRALQKLGGAVAEDIAQMLGQGISAAEGFPEGFREGLVAATIPMSLADARVEIRVSVVVDERTARWLKGAALGNPDASDDARDDALREFANLAGGALKRQALAENITLTTGIPVTEQFASSHGQRVWSLSAAEPGACIVLVAEVRSKENQRVAATELSEGMIVITDVCNDGGLLLVPAGSRLTSTSAARLGRLLGSRFFVDVAPAA